MIHNRTRRKETPVVKTPFISKGFLNIVVPSAILCAFRIIAPIWQLMREDSLGVGIIQWINH